MLLLVRLCVLLLLIVQQGLSLCRWEIGPFKEWRFPLILDYENSIILPTELNGRNRIIRVKNKQPLTIACPGDGNKLVIKKKKSKYPYIKASCIDENEIDVEFDGGSKQMMTEEISQCSSSIEAHWEKVTDGNCINGQPYDITFEYSKNYIIRACFSEKYETTLWTKHILHGENYQERNEDFTDRKYKDMDIFKPILNTIYRPTSQRDLIQKLKIKEDKGIISDKRYLEKGHLSPFADFITEPEMDASNHYINIVPQWKDVNHGNWGNVERKVRDLATKGKKKRNLKIISGVHGIQTLKKTTVESVEIFLGKMGTNSNCKKDECDKLVPVPNILWKIVIDGKKAVAFIVHNDPFLAERPELLCDDICEKLDWLGNFDRFERKELCHGFTYCCELNDNLADEENIYKQIPKMPNEGNFGILNK